MPHDNKDWSKIWKKQTISYFKNDKNVINFDPRTQKSQKLVLWLVPFVQII